MVEPDSQVSLVLFPSPLIPTFRMNRTLTLSLSCGYLCCLPTLLAPSHTTLLALLPQHATPLALPHTTQPPSLCSHTHTPPPRSPDTRHQSFIHSGHHVLQGVTKLMEQGLNLPAANAHRHTFTHSHVVCDIPPCTQWEGVGWVDRHISPWKPRMNLSMSRG